MSRPPCYSILRFVYNRKEISADSLSRERKLMRRFIFDILDILEEKGKKVCIDLSDRFLKKDSKGRTERVFGWLIFGFGRDNVIDSGLKHRRQNTFGT